MLAIQVVEILWTKATRGAPHALERVALPRAFSINGMAGACLIQRFRLAEWEDFQPQLLKTEVREQIPGTEGVLRIVAEAERSFSLGVLGTPNAGQPKRHPVPDVVRLLPGKFARLVVNARHTSYSGQHYSETTFNVTCGDAVPANRFVDGQPDHDIDLKAHLF